MLRFLIDCQIFDEVATKKNEESISEIIENKLKKDPRVTLLRNNSYIFYKESDKENLIKEYPELAEAIVDDDDIDTFLEWKYQTEDEEIEGVAGKIILNHNDMNSFADRYLKRISDNELFNNLQSKIDEAEYYAKDLTIKNALIDLLENVKIYADSEEIELDFSEIIESV